MSILPRPKTAVAEAGFANLRDGKMKSKLAYICRGQRVIRMVTELHEHEVGWKPLDIALDCTV